MYNLRTRKVVDYNEIASDYELQKLIDKHQEIDDDYVESWEPRNLSYENYNSCSSSCSSETDSDGELASPKWKQIFAAIKDNISSPLSFIFVISIYTRMRNVNDSPIVVWDEAHFGKFANFYILRNFYFDVHPPLGKMIISLIGYIFSYNGSFAFNSGSLYNDNVPIKEMRIGSALFGAMISPLMYASLRNLKIKKSVATIVASMTIFDNALLVISKFVLLDSILMFFTMLSIYFATAFMKKSREPFTASWIAYMCLTGISLGATLSVKWVGLFTYAFVGLFTVKDLWNLLPVVRYDARRWKDHFIYRAVFLIIVPFSVYYASFVVHFKMLEKSGPGDAQMSTMFQACLKNSTMPKFSKPVPFGSLVTIKNQGSHHGILHSHDHKYPEGSRQLQITLYHHKDVNNWFEILHPLEKSTMKSTATKDEINVDDDINQNDVNNTNLLNNLVSNWIHGKEKEEVDQKNKLLFIRHNTIIRLNHNKTRSNLHSHNVNAYLSSFDNEVSGYGSEKSGDDNDLWKVEIIDKNINSVNDNVAHDTHDAHVIYNIITLVRFKHVKTGCYLTTSGNKLPLWGYEQLEVTCTFKPDSNALWNFEDMYEEKEEDVVNVNKVEGINIVDDSVNRAINHVNSNVNKVKVDDSILIEGYCPNLSMMRNFWDLNVAMFRGNNALTKKPGKRDLLISDPSEWMFMQKGIRMCNWEDKTKKYYMLGNPFVWWSSSLSLIAFLTNFAYLVMKGKMGMTVSLRDEKFMQLGSLLFSGWVLHYAPFFIMGRVTYLHHYFPSLLISMLTTGLMFDRWIPNIKQNLIETVLVAIYAGSFIYFAPLSYGFEGNSDLMKGRQWLTTWNLV